VQRLAPVFLQTAMACLTARPDLRFILPCANPARREQLESIFGEILGHDNRLSAAFSIVDGRSLDAMQASDLVILASGTATLEAMLLKRPMVVCYKLSAITWALASRLLKVPYVSLPNLLAGRELVPELLQHDVTVENLCREVTGWLDDPVRQAEISADYERIHHSIRLGADQQAATAIARFLEHRQVVNP
jgi:lipid-A-disaccharide synthase